MGKIPDNYRGFAQIKIMKIYSGIYYKETIDKLDNKKTIRAEILGNNSDNSNIVYMYPGNNLFLTLYYSSNDDLYESIEGCGENTYLIRFIKLSK